MVVSGLCSALAWHPMWQLNSALPTCSPRPGPRPLACLQRLLLRCCQLPSVPADLPLLSQLTHLDLSRNQLVELPPTMSTLGALRELVAEGNCFPRIPQVWGCEGC